jgi:hypothetical protein
VTVTAREVGDDAMALSARQRLAPLLEGITDPYLHAASQLAMAWTSPIVDDLHGALREASASLEEFRGQDEPPWDHFDRPHPRLRGDDCGPLR